MIGQRIGVAYAEIILDTRRFLAGLQTAGQAFRNTVSGMSLISNQATRTLLRMTGLVTGVYALTKAVRTAWQASRDFDIGWRRVWTTMDESQERMRALAEEIGRLSTSFGYQEAEGLKAFYDITSAGFTKAADALTIFEAAGKTAIAGVSDVSTSANLLVSILNAYGMSVKEVNHVMDLLFTAVKRGGTLTIDNLAMGFGRVTSIAGQLNVSLEEALAAVGSLTIAGMPVREVYTGMASTMKDMLSPSKSLAEIYQRLGFETGRAMLSQHGFAESLKIIMEEAKKTGAQTEALFTDIRALRTVLPLIGKSSKDFAEILEELRNSAGTTEEAFEKMQGPAFWLQVSIAKLTRLFRVLGDVVLPPLANFLKNHVIPIIETATAWIKQNQENLRALLHHMVRFLKTVGIIALVAKAFSLLTKPIVWLIALSAALYIAWDTNLFRIRELVTGFVDWAKGALSTVFDIAVKPIFSLIFPDEEWELDDTAKAALTAVVGLITAAVLNFLLSLVGFKKIPGIAGFAVAVGMLVAFSSILKLLVTDTDVDTEGARIDWYGVVEEALKMVLPPLLTWAGWAVGGFPGAVIGFTLGLVADLVLSAIGKKPEKTEEVKKTMEGLKDTYLETYEGQLEKSSIKITDLNIDASEAMEASAQRSAEQYKEALQRKIEEISPQLLIPPPPGMTSAMAAEGVLKVFKEAGEKGGDAYIGAVTDTLNNANISITHMTIDASFALDSAARAFASEAQAAFQAALDSLKLQLPPVPLTLPGLTTTAPSSGITLPGFLAPDFEEEIRKYGGRQEGGFVPGKGLGDIVPAMLEPGEFVVPRWMMRIPWLGSLIAWIWRRGRKMQGGGAVEEERPQGPFHWPEWLYEHMYDKERAKWWEDLINSLLLPIQQTSIDFGEITDKAQELEEALTEDIESLEEEAAATEDVTGALENLEARIESLADFISGMAIEDPLAMANFLAQLTDMAEQLPISVIEAVSGKYKQLVGTLEDLIQWFEQTRGSAGALPEVLETIERMLDPLKAFERQIRNIARTDPGEAARKLREGIIEGAIRPEELANRLTGEMRRALAVAGIQPRGGAGARPGSMMGGLEVSLEDLRQVATSPITSEGLKEIQAPGGYAAEEWRDALKEIEAPYARHVLQMITLDKEKFEAFTPVLENLETSGSCAARAAQDMSTAFSETTHASRCAAAAAANTESVLMMIGPTLEELGIGLEKTSEMLELDLQQRAELARGLISELEEEIDALALFGMETAEAEQRLLEFKAGLMETTPELLKWKEQLEQTRYPAIWQWITEQLPEEVRGAVREFLIAFDPQAVDAAIEGLLGGYAAGIEHLIAGIAGGNWALVLTGGVEIAAQALQDLGGVARDAQQTLENAFNAVIAGAQQLSRSFLDLVSSTEQVSKIQRAMAEIKTGFIGLLLGFLGPIGEILQRIAKIFTKTEEDIYRTGLNIPTGWRIERVRYAAAKPGEPPISPEEGEGASLLSSLSEELKAAIENMLESIRNFVDTITGLWEQLAPYVVEAILPVLQTFIDALAPIADWITNVLVPDLQGFFTAFGEWWRNEVDPFLKGEFFPQLGEWLVALYTWGKDEFLPFLRDEVWPFLSGPVWETVQEALTGMGEHLADIWQSLKEKWPLIKEWILKGIDEFFKEIQGKIDIAYAQILADAGDTWGALKHLWKSESVSLWDKVKLTMVMGVKALWDWLSERLGPVGRELARLFGSLVNLIGTLLGVLSPLIFLISGALDLSIRIVVAALQMLSNAVDALTSVIKFVANGIIGVINALIDIVNLIPFVDIPHIPYLQRGGIVFRPTLAVVGEAGPEAVIPLSKMASFRGEIMIQNVITLDGEVVYRNVKKHQAKENLISTGHNLVGVSA